MKIFPFFPFFWVGLVWVMNECDVKLIVFLGFEVSRKREEKKGREGNRRRRKRREREREEGTKTCAAKSDSYSSF